MLTGDLRSTIDRIWNAFWTGGLSNPLSVIEQISYLLFIKRLDDLHRLQERKANLTQKPLENPVFGPDAADSPYQDSTTQQPYAWRDLRWSYFKNAAPDVMHRRMMEAIFPFIKTLNVQGDDATSTYAEQMEDAVFLISKPSLLADVVEMIDSIPMDDRDTKGDLYEYMLSKLQTSGQNGQFRTPRHIIALMVDLMAPTPDDIVCDPACGTAGFLVLTSQYLHDHHHDLFLDAALRHHYNTNLFHGFDFDPTMLRIGSMNMMLHGVQNPNIVRRDALSKRMESVRDQYTLVLANPPFKGSLDYEDVAPDLLQTVKTKKTELLFLALFLRMLRPGGRCAAIVPDGVLFGNSKAHRTLRQTLVENHKLEAIISMPSGVFKPYAGVSTGILIFTKTGTGGTDHVWFYDMQADGFSLDDKRTPLDAETHATNNLPDIRTRWRNRTAEHERPRTAQSFMVPKAEIAANRYDLSLNRYKEIVYEEVQYDPPHVILAELQAMETEIQQGMEELRRMLA